jgi:hypothetical protein
MTIKCATGFLLSQNKEASNGREEVERVGERMHCIPGVSKS